MDNNIGLINGIIVDGKVYVPDPSHKDTCLWCYFIGEFGDCEAPCGGICQLAYDGASLQPSQELTDKLNKP